MSRTLTVIWIGQTRKGSGQSKALGLNKVVIFIAIKKRYYARKSVCGIYNYYHRAKLMMFSLARYDRWPPMLGFKLPSIESNEVTMEVISFSTTDNLDGHLVRVKQSHFAKWWLIPHQVTAWGNDTTSCNIWRLIHQYSKRLATVLWRPCSPFIYFSVTLKCTHEVSIACYFCAFHVWITISAIYNCTQCDLVLRGAVGISKPYIYKWTAKKYEK